MANSLKEKTFSGILWSSLERFSVQGCIFVIQIIMARMLTPEDYGVIGMLSIFLAISQSFIDSGFSNALIRKQNRTEVDYSTVFYFNIGIGLLFYFLLFILSPYIANFYNTPVLNSVTKVVALNLVVNSLAVVQRAKLTINIDFKTQAKASLVAVIISGILGVYLAYMGFGVWALVTQTLCNTTLNVCLLWGFSKWIPIRRFSISSFKQMFSFGSKLLVAGLIDTIYKNVYTLVIGKKFASVQLGFYTRADQFAQFPSSNLTGILQRVTFPIFSNIQNDDDRLQKVYRKYLCMSAFFVFPLMMGLAALSQPFVTLLLTDKWDGVVVLLQILCVSYMWYPIHAINLNLLQVKGRSDLFLKLEIIKKTIGICILVITIPLGVKFMCLGKVLSSFLALFINTYYTGKIIQVGFLKQMKDLFPIFINSLSMGIVVFLTMGLFPENWMRLSIGVLIGVLYYFLVALFIKSEELQQIYSFIKLKFNKRKV